MPPPQFRGDAYEKDVPYKKYGCLSLMALIGTGAYGANLAKLM